MNQYENKNLNPYLRGFIHPNVDVNETLQYGTPLLIQITEVQHLINIIYRWQAPKCG